MICIPGLKNYNLGSNSVSFHEIQTDRVTLIRYMYARQKLRVLQNGLLNQETRVSLASTLYRVFSGFKNLQYHAVLLTGRVPRQESRHFQC